MREKIVRGRLEAFSDGVIAIILTIMVLELKIRRDSTARDLFGLTPVFIANERAIWWWRSCGSIIIT